VQVVHVAVLAEVVGELQCDGFEAGLPQVPDRGGRSLSAGLVVVVDHADAGLVRGQGGDQGTGRRQAGLLPHAGADRGHPALVGSPDRGLAVDQVEDPARGGEHGPGLLQAVPGALARAPALVFRPLLLARPAGLGLQSVQVAEARGQAGGRGEGHRWPVNPRLPLPAAADGRGATPHLPELRGVEASLLGPDVQGPLRVVHGERAGAGVPVQVDAHELGEAVPGLLPGQGVASGQELHRASPGGALPGGRVAAGVTGPSQRLGVDSEAVPVSAMGRAGPAEPSAGLPEQPVRVVQLAPAAPQQRFHLVPVASPANPLGLVAVHHGRPAALALRVPTSKLSTVSTRWPAAKSSRSATSYAIRLPIR